MHMVDRVGTDVTEGLAFLDYLVSPDLVEDFRFTLGERLERLGYFGQLPGAGVFQGVLLLFESTVLVHVRSETKSDVATRFGDSDQLVE